ncbi:phosphopantetheine-binding protein, partial [Bacillus cereus]
NPVEAIVYRIWREVLEINNIPNDTDTFFSLGGSSMLATQVVGNLASQYKIKVKIRDVFIYSSFRQFVDFLDNNFKTEILLLSVYEEVHEGTGEEVTI